MECVAWGSLTERGTEPKAAWCDTKSIPTGTLTNWSVTDISFDELKFESERKGLMLSIELVSKLSSTRTFPALYFNRYSTRLEPIKPEPPVTRKDDLLMSCVWKGYCTCFMRAWIWVGYVKINDGYIVVRSSADIHPKSGGWPNLHGISTSRLFSPGPVQISMKVPSRVLVEF